MIPTARHIQDMYPEKYVDRSEGTYRYWHFTPKKYSYRVIEGYSIYTITGYIL
jgi:hypothetical protein